MSPNPIVDRVIAYMWDNYFEQETLPELARMVHASPSYLWACFVNTTGVTPRGYRTAIRIYHAKLLLATTDTPVTDVGRQVGYISHAGFIKAFTRHAGATPKMWRRSANYRGYNSPEPEQVLTVLGSLRR